MMKIHDYLEALSEELFDNSYDSFYTYAYHLPRHQEIIMVLSALAVQISEEQPNEQALFSIEHADIALALVEGLAANGLKFLECQKAARERGEPKEHGL